MKFEILELEEKMRRKKRRHIWFQIPTFLAIIAEILFLSLRFWLVGILLAVGILVYGSFILLWFILEIIFLKDAITLLEELEQEEDYELCPKCIEELEEIEEIEKGIKDKKLCGNCGASLEK